MMQAWETVYFLGSMASRLANVLFYRGSIYQTLSARAHIEARDDAAWEPLERRIDRLAGWFGAPRHCSEAWRDEVARARRAVVRDEASAEPDHTRF